MHPDLVGASGLQIALNQSGGTVEDLNRLIIGGGGFAPTLNYCHLFTVIRAAADIALNAAGRGRRDAVNNGIIGALNRMLGKLLAQKAVRHIIFSNNEQPARLLVYAVDNAGAFDTPYSGQIIACSRRCCAMSST